MAERKATGKGGRKADVGFSAEEKAAARERAREFRRAKSGPGDGEADVQAKIAEMTPGSRAMAERIHALVRSTAPELVPRTWYGMPAYSKGDQVVLFFQPGEKFKVRYGTLGFSDEAHLDEGRMWPNSYAITELTKSEEAKIVELIRRALG